MVFNLERKQETIRTWQTASLVLLLQGILEGPTGYLLLEIPRHTYLGAGEHVAVKM